jgi:hypothetical protein
MDSSKFNFDTIVEAIGKLSDLIKKFADMLKNFVNSWKKVPAAANGDQEVEDPYGE